MPTSPTIPTDGAIADSGEPALISRCDRESAASCDVAAAAMRLAQERDRVAIGMSDTVVRRLFAAGLALESALALMDEHPAARKVGAAIAELELAIRDVRHVVFDRHGSLHPSG